MQQEVARSQTESQMMQRQLEQMQEYIKGYAARSEAEIRRLRSVVAR